MLAPVISLIDFEKCYNIWLDVNCPFKTVLERAWSQDPYRKRWKFHPQVVENLVKTSSRESERTRDSVKRLGRREDGNAREQARKSLAFERTGREKQCFRCN